ncbi:uncharacterized protein LOC62_04G005824 [Vanrija pseudolonga]|uniref:CFA20 domain-containing protein n=1 Tax=Vanrija pseudolonga TaxID=143232 RepID=A0AAF0Y952_9TREE|nr:hypothetical protein LOC62_04G005824 [Vanrija pseudolonga]
MSLLSGTVQPPLLTLLNTAGGLSPLWHAHVGADPRSLVEVLEDSEYPRAEGSSSAATHVPKHAQRGSVAGRVVHLQSADIGDTYLQAGASVSRKAKGKAPASAPLGVELPWLGLQIKPLGRRGLSVEVGVLDSRGREGAIRLSSWLEHPRLRTSSTPPLLHLPLALPTDAARLTDWVEVCVNLAPLIPLFRSIPSDDDDADDGRERKKPRLSTTAHAALPQGALASISYVRVYANCRLRRVWCARDGQRTVDAVAGDEWALVAAAGAAA